MSKQCIYEPATVENSKVGDTIFSLRWGFGIIFEISDSSDCAICCEFELHPEMVVPYNTSGRSNVKDYTPSLFHAPLATEIKPINRITPSIVFIVE